MSTADDCFFNITSVLKQKIWKDRYKEQLCPVIISKSSKGSQDVSKVQDCCSEKQWFGLRLVSSVTFKSRDGIKQSLIIDNQ